MGTVIDFPKEPANETVAELMSEHFRLVGELARLHAEVSKMDSEVRQVESKLGTLGVGVKKIHD